MRFLSPTLLVAALVLPMAMSASAVEQSDPKPVPVVAFQSMDGQDVTIEDFVGKTVVLNFWATWCAPCKREMPSLDRLQAEFNKDEVLVLALAADRAEPGKLQSWMDDIGIENLEIYRDPKRGVAQKMGVFGLPLTVIVDAEGNEVARHAGYAEWDTPEIVELVRQISATTQ